MANVIIVAGEVSTGKSASLQNLNPEETFVVNVLNKPLPFRGSKKVYNPEKKNTLHTDNYATIVQLLNGIEKSMPHIKTIVLDDVGAVMTSEFFARADEIGYGKFAEMGQHMQKVIVAAKNLSDKINVVFMFHVDNVVSNRVVIAKQLKLIGQMLDDKYNPLSVVTICLFTDVDFTEEDGATYSFITNRCSLQGVEIPAKSPQGMFDNLRIPNDLKSVFDKMENFYN